MTCQNCGAECTEGTSFCRQCGVPIASEQTTALLNQSDDVSTHRLEPRATAPNRGAVPADGLTASVTEKSGGRRKAILIGTLIAAVVGAITATTLIGMRSHRAAANDLIYPGARTVVDMTSEGGGRALHLQTPDPMAKVEAWYQKTLKPDKTMRLTSSSVVLRNSKTTATIAAEDNTTNILIKVAN